MPSRAAEQPWTTTALAAATPSCSAAVQMVKQGVKVCGSSPSTKTHQLQSCWPLSPTPYNCEHAAWISSQLWKCNSQVNPPRRGRSSGNRESEASSSLCSYSIKLYQHWKKKKITRKKKYRKRNKRKKGSVKLSHAAAQNFLLCFCHHLLITPQLCSFI